MLFLIHPRVGPDSDRILQWVFDLLKDELPSIIGVLAFWIIVGGFLALLAAGGVYCVCNRMGSFRLGSVAG